MVSFVFRFSFPALWASALLSVVSHAQRNNYRKFRSYLCSHATYLHSIATLVVAGANNRDEHDQMNFSAINFGELRPMSLCFVSRSQLRTSTSHCFTGIGIFTLINAISNMYLICVHPGFKAGKGAMGAFR